MQCVGDIFNDDGVLRCSRGMPAPPGSYTASCEQIRVEGKDLLANCRSRRGNLIGARLSDWRQCTSQIANNDGMLLPAGTALARWHCVPLPGVLAWLTTFVELIGGLAVLAGAFLPIISIPLAVEDRAMVKGCAIVLLASHSFQAPAFYEKMGYVRQAEIADHPVGHSSIFFAKRLRLAAENGVV